MACGQLEGPGGLTYKSSIEVLVSEVQPPGHSNSSFRHLALFQWRYYPSLFEEQHVEPAYLTMLFELSNPEHGT